MATGVTPSITVIAGVGGGRAVPLTVQVYGFCVGSLLAMESVKLHAPPAVGVNETLKVVLALPAIGEDGCAVTLAAADSSRPG